MMLSNLTDNNRSWIWSVVLTIALGLVAAYSFSKVWPNTSSGWIIWLGLAAGGIGGLAHEFGQSRGKLLFFKRAEDGIYLGAVAGMFMGMVAGSLAVQGLFNQVAAAAPVTPQRPLAVEAFYTAFLAGLALKGFAEAVGGQPIATRTATGSGPMMTIDLPASPIPPKLT